MRHALVSIAAGLLFAANVAAQPYGPGPGMMGGYDMGPGMMGGYGMGPGMMGGYGMGPGMMGGYGMGPGMMGSYGAGALNLTDEQRTKIAEIEKESGRKQWELMEQMHQLHWRSSNPYQGGKFDEQAARQAFDAMTEIRKKMFENTLDARKRIDGVLTAEQREQLQRGRPGR